MSSSKNEGQPHQSNDQEASVSVDPSSNVRGAYRTLYFRCPKCGYSKVLLKVEECPNCNVKLNWN